MGEECVRGVDRPREQVSIEGLVEQRWTTDTGARLDGASMNAVQVDNDKLEGLKLALDSLWAALALMSEPTNEAEVD